MDHGRLGEHYFISYSRRDLEIARQIKEDLKKYCFEIWLDESNIVKGANWDNTIRESIRRSIAVLYLASPDSRSSWYVRRELELAKDNKISIIPLWIRGETKWTNIAILGYSKVKYIDMRLKMYKNGIDEITQILKNPSDCEARFMSYLRGDNDDSSLQEVEDTRSQSPIDQRKYHTCFISYSSKDQGFAERLHIDLRNEGVQCWFAPEDMEIGDKIRHQIEESILLYDKLLLVLSEHSIRSSWVEFEVERALNKEPQGVPNVLFPVRLDDTILTCHTSWAQDIRSTRHIGDFTCWRDHDSYQKSFKRLLRALQQKHPTRET